MRIRTWSVAALVFVLTAAVSGAARADGGTALDGAPPVGTCYTANGAELGQDSLSAAPVSCRQRHTLWTYYVAPVPDGVALTTGPDNRALFDYVNNVCVGALESTVHRSGRRLYLSSYAWFWFVPSPSQQQLGARWISCELGIAHGESRVVPNRLQTPPRLKPNPPQQMRSCFTKRFGPTNCAARHAYRAIYAAAVMTTPELVDQVAGPFCARHLRGRPGGYRWQRFDSQRYVVWCGVRTRH